MDRLWLGTPLYVPCSAPYSGTRGPRLLACQLDRCAVEVDKAKSKKGPKLFKRRKGRAYFGVRASAQCLSSPKECQEMVSFLTLPRPDIYLSQSVSQDRKRHKPFCKRTPHRQHRTRVSSGAHQPRRTPKTGPEHLDTVLGEERTLRVSSSPLGPQTMGELGKAAKDVPSPPRITCGYIFHYR